MFQRRTWFCTWALTWASYQEHPGVVQAFQNGAASADGYAAHRIKQSVMYNSLPGIQDEQDFDKEMKVRDIIKKVFERISQITEQQQQLSHCPSTLFDHSGLTGYEFLDIALFEENLIAKRTSEDPGLTGDWLKLVEKWPDMAVILCANLGEPIRPAKNCPCATIGAACLRADVS